MNWKESQLRQKKKSGKIRGYKVTHKKRNNIRTNEGKKFNTCEKKSKEKEWLGWNLMFWSNENSLVLETEYQFDKKRLWRFDFAWPSIKVAVEYEGIFSEKSRHTTVKGYAGDVEKYNAATLQGWKVIRLTAMDYLNVLKLLNEIIKNPANL